MQLISADTLIPMHDDLLLRDAGIVTDNGKILATGKTSDLKQQFPTAKHQHHPGLLLPGFINAHVHLELTYQKRKHAGPVKFTEWVSDLMKSYPAPTDLEATITSALHAGIAQSLAAGVTTVGDISRHSALTRPLLANSPLRAVSFGEIVSLGKMRGRLATFLEAAAATTHASDKLTIGLSPHAPYTVEGPSLAAIAQRAIAENLPLAMHLAELAEETEFIHTLAGPLGSEWDLMQKMDVLDAAIPVTAGGPLRWAEKWGLLGQQGAASQIPVLLAHVNYADAAEIELLIRSGASVAYCPRTRNFFGHDQHAPHPYRAMLNAGINVCLGTDSLASNPDLSVLNEAKFLVDRDNLSPQLAFEMITWRAANALGINAGRLTPNTLADFILMPLPAPPGATLNSLLNQLLYETPALTAAWIAGKRVI